MPVKIACPKCSKKYTLPDSAVGKAVKCKGCETTFRTKMPAGAAPASPQSANLTARPTKPTQPKPPQPKQAQRRPAQSAQPNLNEFGIDGGFKEQADLFGSAPQASANLGNFAEQEDGDAIEPIVVGPAGATKPKENPFQSVLTNSSMRDKAARNKSRKKKQAAAGAADLSTYGIVRTGMICVFASGAASMLAYFVSFAISLTIRLAAGTSGKVPDGLAVVGSIVSLVALGLLLLGFLGFVVGQIMCMFAPNNNERLSAIGAVLLAFLGFVGAIVIAAVLGVAVGNLSQTASASVGIGAIVGLCICGAMSIASSFLFVNFYRSVGRNIKSDQLVQSSNLATYFLIAGYALPVLTAGIIFLLQVAGVGLSVVAIILPILLILNMLFGVVVFCVTLKMVSTGISSLRI